MVGRSSDSQWPWKAPGRGFPVSPSLRFFGDVAPVQHLQRVLLTDYIAVNLATAHPHIEENGNVYNIGSSFTSYKGPCYNVVEFPKGQIEEGKVVSSVTPLRRLSPSYYHSFAITENYWILVEQPLVFHLSKMVLGTVLMNNPPVDSLGWLPEEKTVFRVISRKTGNLVSTHYTADAFVTFHHTNAWEENGQIVMDLCATEDGDIVNMLYVSNLKKRPDDENRLLYGTNMRRYILPLDDDVCNAPVGDNLIKRKDTTCKAIKQSNGSIHCSPQILHSDFFDMPRINYKRNGKSYRYAYGVSTKGNDLVFERLLKLDVQTRQMCVFVENDYTVAEPIFVPTPGATEEDDGVIISALLKKADPMYVALLVLNAKDMKEMARVEFRAKGDVTNSFHGQFVGVGEEIHTY